MNNQSPQQVASTNVRSKYNKFCADLDAWDDGVPNPKPVGWIDLSIVRAHPGHAEAVKRMIFESQQPDLFVYHEEQVTYELIQDTIYFPPRGNPQFIVPPPRELFVPMNCMITDYYDSL